MLTASVFVTEYTCTIFFQQKKSKDTYSTNMPLAFWNWTKIYTTLLHLRLCYIVYLFAVRKSTLLWSLRIPRFKHFIAHIIKIYWALPVTIGVCDSKWHSHKITLESWRRNTWYIRRLCCHSERPVWAELSREETNGVHLGQVWSLTPVEQ